MEEIGPDLGYHANATKSWLIVKEEHAARAAELFQGTDVQITMEDILGLQWGLIPLWRHM